MAVNCFSNRLQRCLEMSETAKILKFLRALVLGSALRQFVQSGQHLLRRSIGSIRGLAKKSIGQAITVYGSRVAVMLRNKLLDWGLTAWKPVFEAAIILIVVFMPILNYWGLLLPLLFLLCLGSDGSANPLANELGFFWLALFIGACFSGSFRSGIPSFITYSSWLLITYVSGKAFSRQFSKKLLYFLVYTNLLWLSIGIMQQWAGVPTPPGWLGQEQSNLIMVRSYSLFGNPNIFALYLVGMMVFTCYFITDALVCLKGKEKKIVEMGVNLPWPLLEKEWGKLGRNFLRIQILLLFLILFLIIVALYFTYSRIAWLIGITLLLAQCWPRLGKWRWPVLLMVPLFLLTLPGFKIRIATLITLTDSSLRYRMRIWQGVCKALPSYWLWGAGPGSFGAVYPWYQIKDTISAHAHQIFLQLWLENGILSLAAFLWLIKKMNFGFIHDHQLSKAIAMVIMIFLGYGLTETWVQNRLIGGYFWLFCGLWISSKGEGLEVQ